MFISDTAIKRPVLTVVAMLILVVFGIVALTQLDTDEFPEIDAPQLIIRQLRFGQYRNKILWW